MKSKLFLLVGCLIAAVSLSAQTIDLKEVQGTDGVSSTQLASQTLTVYVYTYDDAGMIRVAASLDAAISCDMRILGRIRWSIGGSAVGAEDFSIRIPAGESYGRASQSIPYNSRYTYYLEGDEEGPATCGSYNIVYVWN